MLSWLHQINQSIESYKCIKCLTTLIDAAFVLFDAGRDGRIYQHSKVLYQSKVTKEAKKKLQNWGKL